MNAFAVRYSMEVGIGKTTSKNLFYAGVIPFVPVAGMSIQVDRDDDYREVEDVYWSADDQVLRVFLVFDDHTRIATLKACGWEVEP